VLQSAVGEASKRTRTAELEDLENQGEGHCHQQIGHHRPYEGVYGDVAALKQVGDDDRHGVDDPDNRDGESAHVELRSAG